MIAARVATAWVVWAVGLAVSTAAYAQVPEEAAPAITAQALDTPPSAARPTRRPTRAPTPVSTATATAADTETPSPPPPTTTATATRARPATATFTQVAVTPTPTRRAIAFVGGAGGTALPLALGGGLALVGVWLGARLAGARERIARRRARRTLATAMLLELRRIDAVLRRVVGLDNPASFPSLEHPIMEAALRELTLFNTETAARITQFHSALLGIQHEIGDYRDNPLRWAGRLGELNQLIKARAAAACRAVPELLKGLEREGGAPPPHLSEPPSSAAATPSGLPPPPFGAGEGDDWTF